MTSQGTLIMTHFDHFAGIDICKDRLDVYCHPGGQTFHVANTPAGIKKLLARLDSGSYAIGCEATGGYEDRLLVALSEAGRPGYCLHPADIRAFTRLKGRRAKTDRLDGRSYRHGAPDRGNQPQAGDTDKNTERNQTDGHSTAHSDRRH